MSEIGIHCICGQTYSGTPDHGYVTCPYCKHIWNLKSGNIQYDQQAANERIAKACAEAKAKATMTVEEFLEDIAKRTKNSG